MADEQTTDETAPDRTDAATPEEVDRLAEAFREAGRPFARVTVVRREPPVSANVGDRALVTDDGDLHGWIGGVACAQSVAIKEATNALDSGEPVFVGLAPDPDDVARSGLNAYPMTCHSGGTLELFVEPVVSAPRLVLFGESPIARALGRLAPEVGYDVRVVRSESSGDETDRDDAVAVNDTDALSAALDGSAAVVVATMGEYDEAALDATLRTSAPYVGLIASRRRAEDLTGTVAETLGSDPDAVSERVTTPAGLDIGARTPEEIALSVLAELVAVRRGEQEVGTATALGTDEESSAAENGHDGHSHDDHAHHEHGEATDNDTEDAETAVDPVCGMTVVVGEAATVEHDGETYRFCGQGCVDAFEDDPERFLDAVVSSD